MRIGDAIRPIVGASQAFKTSFMELRLAIWVVPLLVLGCQDLLFEQKCPEAIKEAQLDVPAATPTPADILFVVDNSGSMADEQQNLADNFDRFINSIAGVLDYHIMVVTTDRDGGAQGDEIGGLVEVTGNAGAPYFAVTNQFVSRTDCTPLVGLKHSCARGPDPTRRIIRSSELSAPEQIAAFAQNVKVGSCGSGVEAGLDGMLEALNLTGNGQCNAGFLREEANLIVVLVSDEGDQSIQNAADYVDELVQIKPASQIRVATITSADGAGAEANCRTDPGSGASTTTCGDLCNTVAPDPENPNWADNCMMCAFYAADDCCSAVSTPKYHDFARRMEDAVANVDSRIVRRGCLAQPGEAAACLLDSICQDNFGDTLERIATELVIATDYNLSPPATNPAGVVARVRGGRFPDGVDLVNGEDFTVSQDGARLSITSAQRAPREGESVEIFFVVENDRTNEAPVGACE